MLSLTSSFLKNQKKHRSPSFQTTAIKLFRGISHLITTYSQWLAAIPRKNTQFQLRILGPWRTRSKPELFWQKATYLHMWETGLDWHTINIHSNPPSLTWYLQSSPLPHVYYTIASLWFANFGTTQLEALKKKKDCQTSKASVEYSKSVKSPHGHLNYYKLLYQ